MQDGKNVILCIDDDPDILENLTVVLEGAGYVVATASTAEGGLKKYKEVSPDCIIVDLMMEEVDAGTAFVKELKADGNSAPIFMLSSVGDEMHKMTDTTSLGLSGVFQKPIKPDTLLKTLSEKLG